MRKMVLGLLIAVLVQAAALAQTPDEHKGQGYVYFAPGVATFEGESEGTLHIGAGGEGLVYRGLGVGAEAGYRTEEQLAGFGKGMFSPNVSYHFLSRNPESKAEPFVTGGYTRFFGDGSANGFNFGGGLNYWFKERIGTRFEVRDNVLVVASGGQIHFVGFRIGLAFR